MNIKSFFKDLSGIFRVMKLRKNKINNANKEEIPEDKLYRIAEELHPGKFVAVVSDIIRETSFAKRIVFSSNKIPHFKAGQYLTVELKIGNSVVTRPYSIVSSPDKAYREKQIEIIVAEAPNGFVSTYLNHDLKIGDEVILEVGLGFFTIEEYRDGDDVVAIAGGAGITPFLSMAHDIVENNRKINLTILYGNDNPNEIIAKEEIESLQQDNIRVVHVISGNYKWNGEKGFITKEIIKKYSRRNSRYFFCGIKVMYDEIVKELSGIAVDLRRIRHDAFPIDDVTKFEGFDKTLINSEFDIEVHQGINVTHIKAKATESISTALERSGLRIHTCCRGGECGACRVKVIKGEYFVPEENDGRRATDKEYGYVHSCCTYPKSDLIIKINIA